MNNQSSKPGSSSSGGSGGGLIDWITQYDSLVIFGGLGGMIFLTVLYTGLFQAGFNCSNQCAFQCSNGNYDVRGIYLGYFPFYGCQTSYIRISN